jgi:hypothetical protein
MKKKIGFRFTFPDYSIYVAIAMYIVYGFKVALFAFFSLGLVYTVCRGK